MMSAENLLKVIVRRASKMQRHRVRCRCIRCARLRVRLKRYARRRGLLSEDAQ
jgi:hypothetical protein